MSLSNLKKNSSFDKLKKALDSAASGSSNNKGRSGDTRFWKPEVDSAGNAFAIIRFLDTPEVDGQDSLPWIQIWNHGFQGPGGWYIEDSLTTIGQKDPVGEFNTKLWSESSDDESPQRKQVRKQKRKLTYISNILVISDPKHPENEGKVFLFKYGKKIFAKIQEKIQPEFEDEQKLNPFDFWKGANFRLKQRKVDGYPNYDKSEFDAESALFDGDDAKIEKVWKSEYSLKEFLDPKNFKSYDELKAKLNKVLGAGGVAAAAAPKINDRQESPPSPGKQKVTAESMSSEEDEDDLDYFKRLADE